jgi:hypothetical protein
LFSSRNIIGIIKLQQSLVRRRWTSFSSAYLLVRLSRVGIVVTASSLGAWMIIPGDGYGCGINRCEDDSEHGFLISGRTW